MQLPRRPTLPSWILNVALGLVALGVLVGMVGVLRAQPPPVRSGLVAAAPSGSPSPSTAPVRAVFFGDSIIAGANAGAGNPTLVDAASRLLGWTSSSFGFPGSGFTTAGSFKGGRDYLARLQQLKGYHVDVLVIEGGLNDGAADATTLRAKASAVLASARSLLPNTTLILVGPWSPTGTPTRPAALASLTLKTLAKEQAIAFIDPLAEQWITGSYPSSGNAARYISTDGFYPNAQGHVYFGQRLADDLSRFLPARLLPAG